MANPFNFNLQRLKTLNVKTHDETWEVDVITMPVSIREEGDSEPWNPVCAICASTRGGAMFSTPCRPEELTDSAALEAIASFAQDPHVPEAKPLGFLPPRVRVSRLPESMHEALAASLDELGIHLEVKTELPMVQEFTNTIATIAESSDSPIPAGSILKGRGVTIDHVRSFAEAAAAFYLARPWERITARPFGSSVHSRRRAPFEPAPSWAAAVWNSASASSPRQTPSPGPAWASYLAAPSGP